jgi:hypothetical protein
LVYNSALFGILFLFILVTEAKTGAAAILEKLYRQFICTGVIPHHSPHVDVPICGDHHTTDELCSTLPVSKGSLMAVTKELGYSKVCSCWVPQMVIAANKEMRKATVTDILH